MFKKFSLIFAFAVLFLGQHSASAEEPHKLTHSDAGNFDYDIYKAYDFGSTLEGLITKSDWDNIQHEKFVVKIGTYNDPNSPTPVVEYAYKHNDLYIEFTKNPWPHDPGNPNSFHEYNLDLLKLVKKRLPDYLNKKYILSTLNIQGLHEPIKTLEVGFDMVEIKIVFDGDKIVSIERTMEKD
jgi:hypothetical protein